MKVLKYKLVLLNNIFLCILSLAIYVNSPDVYSYGYNVLVLLFFLLVNFFYFNLNKSFKVGVGFELLFFISFMMGNFIYPVFYYPVSPTVSLFQFSFNASVINKSTSLALVAYCFYTLFSSDYSKKLVVEKIEYSIDKYIGISIFFLSLILFLSYFYFGGISILADVYQGKADLEQVGITSYFSILFEVSTLLLASLIFLVKNIKIRIFLLLYLFILVVIFLSTGSRGMSISILLILLVGYSRSIKRINGLVVFFGVFTGAILMYFLMLLRELGMGSNDNTSFALDKIKNTSNPFDPFMDLIINNRNLYVLVDFVDKVGDVKFFNIITSLFGVFPGLSLIIDFFSVPNYLISGKLPTYLEFGNDASFGLGTNMVGEAYLSLGCLGVIIVFSLFGAMVKYLRFNRSLLSYIAFLLLVGQVVFIVRSDYLFPLRKIVWSLIIFYVVSMLSSKIFTKR